MRYDAVRSGEKQREMVRGGQRRPEAARGGQRRPETVSGGTSGCKTCSSIEMTGELISSWAISSAEVDRTGPNFDWAARRQNTVCDEDALRRRRAWVRVCAGQLVAWLVVWLARVV